MEQIARRPCRARGRRTAASLLTKDEAWKTAARITGYGRTQGGPLRGLCSRQYQVPSQQRGYSGQREGRGGSLHNF
jgi:hypothetical protein